MIYSTSRIQNNENKSALAVVAKLDSVNIGSMVQSIEEWGGGGGRKVMGK
jgi:hypothetical protein